MALHNKLSSFRICLLLVVAVVSPGFSQRRENARKLQSTSGCPVDNGFFADPAQCENYTECKDGIPKQQTCPEGLLYNDKLTEYPRYPCSYPPEVDCGSRAVNQRVAKRSGDSDCPLQYGLFKGRSCSSYINCIEGIPHENECPMGLAFNEATYRCEWPDQVPGCENSVSFQCPGIRVEADLGHPRYSDPEDCRKFWVCVENTKPRLQECGVGFVFNLELGVCDEPANVPNCANYYPQNVLDALQALRSFQGKV